MRQFNLSKFAEKAGSDALLIVTPYYNKPNQEGLYQHYKKINDNVGIPILIYNIPSRSVIDMSVETMTKLFEVKKYYWRERCYRRFKKSCTSKKIHGR